MKIETDLQGMTHSTREVKRLAEQTIASTAQKSCRPWTNDSRIRMNPDRNTDVLMSRVVRRLFALGALCCAVTVLAGCRVGPDYVSPIAYLQSTWNQTLEEDVNEEHGDLNLWWSEFNDPDLNYLIAEAHANNLDLKQAIYRIAEARAQRGVVRNVPELFAVGGYSYTRASSRTRPALVPNQGVFSLWDAGFDAAWELDFWGKYRRTVDAADAEIDLAAFDYNDVLVTLLADVAANYVDARLYQQRISIAQANVEKQTNTYEATMVRFRAGLVGELDITQSKSNLYNTMATIPALQAGFETAKNRLCVLTGRAPYDLDPLLGGEGPIPLIDRPLSVGIPANLLRQRPDIRAAERNVAAHSERIGVAIAELYPQFRLTGNIGVSSADFYKAFTSQGFDFGIGPSFRWNILNFGRLRSNVDVQQARYEQAVVQYRSAVLAAAEEVENNLAIFQRERERLARLDEGVEAATKAVELAQSGYEEGIVNLQNLIDTQRLLFRLGEQQAGSLAELTRRRIALYKALGGGWPWCEPGQALQADIELLPPSPEQVPPSPEDAPAAEDVIPVQDVLSVLGEP